MMIEKNERHQAEVRRLQAEVKSFFARQQPIKIFHGSTNSTRAQTFKPGAYVDVSQLNHILHIDPAGQYVWVEPNVSMDALVEATLPYHLIPPVVMEFPGITVGGGIQGGAVESSSGQYGLFHETCLEYEMILGNGAVMTASPDQNADLFWGTACSYGSLGIITAVKLRLVPAKDFVHLTYRRVGSFAEAIEQTKEAVDTKVTFVDGIMFSPERGVIMTGQLSDQKNLPVATFRRANDEWFYLHANTISRTQTPYEELIPIKDYVFRYDRGAFWMGRYGFSLLHLPFNRLSRRLMNSSIHTRTLYKLLQATNLSQRVFVQDLSLPEHHAVPFLTFIDQTTHIYPLWICPLRAGIHDPLSPAYQQTNLVINIGVWGELRKNSVTLVLA